MLKLNKDDYMKSHSNTRNKNVYHGLLKNDL